MTRIFRFFLQLLPYLFVFLASLYLPTDPDLGWHLKYGEYFFQHHQILRDNIFSSTMTNYHWANGSWGTDVITYAIFHSGGFLGLILVSAAIVTLTFFFFSRAAGFTLFDEALFFPVLVFLESSVNLYSFRGQQISLLFLGILFFILSRYRSGSKILYFVPFLFLLWCNLHAESFLGLALFGIWIIFKIISNYFSSSQTRRTHDVPRLCFIFTVTFLATFINPFVWGIHLDALSHFGDPLLQEITEYIPFFKFSLPWWNLHIIALCLFFWIVYMFFKKTLVRNLSLWGIPCILLLLSFNVRRYAWPAYYLMFPFFHFVGQLLEPRLKKYTLLIACIISLLSITIIVGLKQPFNQYANMSWNTYCTLQDTPCSANSAEYLKAHDLDHNVFSLYEWGGWLIWNYPAIKPGIDGRMHLWRDKNGHSAYEDYYTYLNDKKNIDKSPYDVIYMSTENSPLYQELSDLITQKKWHIAYEDEFTAIVVKLKK